jgi:type III pantothenate kinase
MRSSQKFYLYPVNLVLDFGNTRIKSAVFDGKELIRHVIFDNEEDLLNSALLQLPLRHCLIASVTKQHEYIHAELSRKFDTRLFTVSMALPIANLYKSALSLGSDRMAAAVGSFTLYPDQNVLTIDAGTCIKYNFVNNKNEYLGGGISPGIPMRFKAMHEFTSALPEVKFDDGFSNFLGRNTSESISVGAQTGAVCEVDGMIERYRAEYKNLVTVVTGGDGPYLCSQLKSRFFAHQNILLIGLNAILNHNLEN